MYILHLALKMNGNSTGWIRHTGALGVRWALKIQLHDKNKISHSEVLMKPNVTSDTAVRQVCSR